MWIIKLQTVEHMVCSQYFMWFSVTINTHTQDIIRLIGTECIALSWFQTKTLSVSCGKSVIESPKNKTPYQNLCIKSIDLTII